MRRKRSTEPQLNFRYVAVEESVAGHVPPVSRAPQGGGYWVNPGRGSVPAQPEEMRQTRTHAAQHLLVFLTLRSLLSAF
jgi:hypothetical protein